MTTTADTLKRVCRLSVAVRLPKKDNIIATVMNDSIKNDIIDIFRSSKNWLEFEVEYLKLTAAEKFSILLSVLVLGAIMLLLGIIALGLLSLSLVDVFKQIMSPAMANLSVCATIIVLMLLIYFLRKPLLVNPISRFVTKLFLDKEEEDETADK